MYKAIPLGWQLRLHFKLAPLFWTNVCSIGAFKQKHTYHKIRYRLLEENVMIRVSQELGPVSPQEQLFHIHKSSVCGDFGEQNCLK